MITVTFDLVDDGREDERRALVEELQKLQGKRLAAQEAEDDKVAVLDREIQEKQSLLASLTPEGTDEVEVQEVEPVRGRIDKLKLDAHRAGVSLSWFFARN